MTKFLGAYIILISFFGCIKDDLSSNCCGLDAVIAKNAKKVSITQGIWGTIAFMEGDCMPTVPPSYKNCTTYPVKRRVIVYEYTLQSETKPANNQSAFYDSFTTAEIAETESDDEGFFQLKLLPGKYTLAVFENGKLYINIWDGQGGLNPITVKDGLQVVGVTLMYKAYI